MKRARMAKLGLGTGASVAKSESGRPSAEAAAILKVAAQAGLALVDTGADYGAAEILAGMTAPDLAPFRVTTKALRLEAGVDLVEAGARGFLARLGLTRADTILVPSVADLLAPEGQALWRRLQMLKDEGLFARVGVFANAEDDPVGIAKRFRPDVMQLPASLIDQRLVRDGSLAEIAALGVEVHLASVFVQGLLFEPAGGAPARAGGGPGLSRIRRLIAEAGADPMQAALAFALERPEASAVIVGVRSAAELRAVVAAAAAPPPRLDWPAFALEARPSARAGRAAA